MAEGLWEGPYWEGLGTGAPPEETQRVVPVGPGQGDPGLWRGSRAGEEGRNLNTGYSLCGEREGGNWRRPYPGIWE